MGIPIDKVLPSQILIELQKHKLRLLLYLGQFRRISSTILYHKRVCSVSSYRTFESRSGFSANKCSLKYLRFTIEEVFRFLVHSCRKNLVYSQSKPEVPHTSPKISDGLDDNLG